MTGKYYPRTDAIYLLDTDISSYVIKGGHLRLDSKLRHAKPGQVFISVVTLAELLFGLKSLAYNHPRHADVARFRRLSRVLDWTVPAAEAYADIRNSLLRSGRLIGELDMMIAAHALAADAILITNNTRHFERIVPPLRIENWTQR